MIQYAEVFSCRFLSRSICTKLLVIASMLAPLQVQGAGDPTRAFSNVPSASNNHIVFRNYELGKTASVTPGEAVVIAKDFNFSSSQSATLVPAEGWHCDLSAEGKPEYVEPLKKIEIRRQFDKNGRVWLVGDAYGASGKKYSSEQGRRGRWAFPTDSGTLSANCAVALTYAAPWPAISPKLFQGCMKETICQFRWEKLEEYAPTPSDLNFEIVFLGETVEGELSFRYREFIPGEKKPIFEHEFDIAEQEHILKYKNVVIELIQWDGQVLEFQVISDRASRHSSI